MGRSQGVDGPVVEGVVYDLLNPRDEHEHEKAHVENMRAGSFLRIGREIDEGDLQEEHTEDNRDVN